MHIVIDFDGVIRDPTTNDPMAGAEKGLLELAKNNKITVLTANNTSFAQSWLFDNMKKVVTAGVIDKVTNIKPVADIYIDDRGIKFIDWGSLLNSVQTTS